jgi:hypothetical protein
LLSPGCYASRLAWLGSTCFVTASGGETYLLRQLDRADLVSSFGENSNAETFKHKPKDSTVLVPGQQTTTEWHLLEQPRLRAEVQSVSSAPLDGDLESDRSWLVACVDALGTLTVSCLQISSEGQGLALRTRSSFTVPGMDSVWTQQGPACCTQPYVRSSRVTSSPYIAVARYFPCTVSIYQGELLVRQIRTREHPTSLVFGTGAAATSSRAHSEPSEHQELLYFTEGPCITMCDMRAAEVVARRKIVGGHVATQSSGTVSWYGCDLSGYEMALVGPERYVLVVDVRRWSVLGRWWSCLKYDATSVMFGTRASSPGDHLGGVSRLIYVSGRDNEMACGAWNPSAPRSPAHRHGKGKPQSGRFNEMEDLHPPHQRRQEPACRRLFGFRAEERWVGTTIWSEHGWAGLTERGVLYTLDTSTLS